MIIMFSTASPGISCKEHINLIRRVFPHPVSPIIITGISHLKIQIENVHIGDFKRNHTELYLISTKM